MKFTPSRALELQEQIKNSIAKSRDELPGLKTSGKVCSESVVKLSRLVRKVEVLSSGLISSEINNSSVTNSYVVGVVMKNNRVFSSLVEGDSQIDIVNSYFVNAYINLNNIVDWLKKEIEELPEILPPLDNLYVRNFFPAKEEIPLPAAMMRRYTKSVLSL